MIIHSVFARERPLGTIRGLGPLGFENQEISKDLAFGLLNKTISIIIGIMTVVAGIYFLFLIIIAGYQWLSSGGDKAGVEAARNKLTFGIIGLVIVVAAFALISVIGQILGIEFLQLGETLGSFSLVGGGQ